MIENSKLNSIHTNEAIFKQTMICLLKSLNADGYKRDKLTINLLAMTKNGNKVLPHIFEIDRANQYVSRVFHPECSVINSYKPFSSSNISLVKEHCIEITSMLFRIYNIEKLSFDKIEELVKQIYSSIKDKSVPIPNLIYTDVVPDDILTTYLSTDESKVKLAEALIDNAIIVNKLSPFALACNINKLEQHTLDILKLLSDDSYLKEFIMYTNFNKNILEEYQVKKETMNLLYEITNDDDELRDSFRRLKSAFANSKKVNSVIDLTKHKWRIKNNRLYISSDVTSNIDNDTLYIIVGGEIITKDSNRINIKLTDNYNTSFLLSVDNEDTNDYNY